uniref:Ground-like domain-containing protein n=1 Tax=Ascaris lumbricoides TaxID=6252 RepID=A0A0M3I4J4_ASCLU
MFIWMLLVCAHQVCAHYYGARCLCPPQLQPPIPPHRPCPPPIPCPPLPPPCPPIPGVPRVHPSYSTPVLSPPPLQGRSYGYALPQPYSYYLRENELSNLEKQIKTIEFADEKAHTSPFDTVDVTPVKSTETAPRTRIVPSHVPHIYTPLSESSAYPLNYVGSIGLPPSLPGGCVPGYVTGSHVQPPSYHIPVPQPAIPQHQFPSPIHAPLNDCCIRCGTRCNYRSRRNLRNYDDKMENATHIETKCTDEKLHDIMTNAIKENAESSKREIQKLAEEAFSGDFHVICSSEDFTYITRSSRFCQANNENLSCYAFQTASIYNSIAEDNIK